MTIPEWIIRNLQDHGNSVVPNDLIRKHGEKEVVEAIQEKMGCFIEIRKVESTLSTAPLNNHSHRKLEIVYIAEKVEKYRITLQEAVENPMTSKQENISTIKEKKENAKH